MNPLTVFYIMMWRYWVIMSIPVAYQPIEDKKVIDYRRYPRARQRWQRKA